MPANVRTKYEADGGAIYAMTIKPETAAVAGTAPTGTVTSPIRAKVSKGNKEYGIRPRGVTLSRTVGTAPDTFTKTSFLPVLTATAYASATFALGASVTLNGFTWTIVGKRPEDY